MLGSMKRYLAAVAFLILLSVGCGQPATGPVVEQFSGPTMGTTYTVKMVSEQAGVLDIEALQATVDETLEEVNAKMSHYIGDSELSRFNDWNSTEPFEVSSDLLDVLSLARQIGMATDGAFDITVASLVNAWGFGPAGRAPETPDAKKIEELIRNTGWHRLEIDVASSTVRKKHGELTADLSAIAKGHGVDRVADALAMSGSNDFMVEIGGEVRTQGLNWEGQPWRIGVERPVPGERAIDLVVPLSNLALATSGDYRNYYEIDGQRISHTIDPRTGYPITHTVASVSVVHSSCAAADAYATGLLVLGSDGFEVAEQLDLAAYFLFRDAGGVFMGRMTTRFRELLEETDSRSG